MGGVHGGPLAANLTTRKPAPLGAGCFLPLEKLRERYSVLPAVVRIAQIVRDIRRLKHVLVLDTSDVLPREQTQVLVGCQLERNGPAADLTIRSVSPARIDIPGRVYAKLPEFRIGGT